jgi:hypothetical protein
MLGDIDFVQLWVDGNDKDWHNEKSKYVPSYDMDDSIMRYRDWDNLQYWFRGVEKYAPWVRKIHLITCGHYPKWLNLEHPKLNLVKHSDYMPKDYIPTFNANSIILNIHRIKQLSNKFVFFNDDFFILKKTKETDFFKGDLPCDYAIMDGIAPTDIFSYIEFNNTCIINKHFEKRAVLKNNLPKWYNLSYGIQVIRNILLLPWRDFTGIYDPHLPIPFQKKTFLDVWAAEWQLLDKTCKNKFRSKEDVTEWLLRYWRIMKGEFYPSPILGKNFKFSVNEKSNALIGKIIEKQKYRIVCISDSEMNIDFEKEKLRVNKAFESVFPEKSSYEKA